ncbi:MAG: VWA domain-containing protein [Planctomycetota bacterium]|nr:VWA domain-containing protein [Planctomycetota bacterium]
MPTPTIVLAAAAWRFEHPSALLLLFLVPVVVLILAYSAARSRRSLLLISGITPNQPRASRARQAIRVVLTAAGISSLIIAIARPQSDPVEETVTVRGRDIVFVIDVSRSMLSRDVVPDRLGRTKIWINDLVNTLKGDRVALVAFAGVPVVKCPLTLDQNFFRMELDELSPASVPRGGTLIGDAIRKTMSAVFEPNPGRYRDIVLITDGEDQGSFPAEAAKAAAELGVRIIAIGIGSELEGSQVPAEGKNGFLVHEGTTVRSKMDGTTLAAIAQAASSVQGNGAGGVFLNVGTGTMDLDKVYHDLIASAEQRETDSKASVTYKELFPMFLAAALALLTLDSLLPVGRRPARAAVPHTVRTAAFAMTLLATVAIPVRLSGAQQATAAPSATTSPATPTTDSSNVPTVVPVETSPIALYNAGRELYQAAEFAQAADRFRAADLAATDSRLSARTRFNLGMAMLRQATAKPAAGAPNAAPAGAEAAVPDAKAVLEQLEASVRAFRSALAIDPADDQAARNIEIARRFMQQIKDEQAKQQQQQQKQKGKDAEKSDSKDQSGDSSKQDQNQQPESAKDQEAKQHQEQADKLKDLAKQQSEAADKSKQANQESDPQKTKDASEASRQQQQDVNDKTQAQQEQMKKDSPDESTSKDSLEKARKEQEAASKALEKNDPKSAQQHQEEAAKSLEQAAQAQEKAAQEAREQAAQERQNQQAQKQAKDQAKQDKPKFDESASQALDKERKQREARQQVLRALRGRPVPVDKDW